MDECYYKYHLSKTENRNKRLNLLIQYVFSVKEIVSSKPIDYVINFYRFKNNIFITDFFPKKWEMHPDRVNKLLCKEEKMRVNFRKITMTCVHIFHNEISAENVDASFVANGSLIANEKILPDIQISRKLKLYWDLLKPFAKTYHYRIVEALEYNAILLIKKESKLTDEQIKNDYAEFKNT